MCVVQFGEAHEVIARYMCVVQFGEAHEVIARYMCVVQFGEAHEVIARYVCVVQFGEAHEVIARYVCVVQFGEAHEVIARYATLEQTRKDLMENERESQDSIESQRVNIKKFSEDKNNEVLSCNNKLASLQAQLEAAQARVMKW